ncbi:MAG: LysR family transcriptional regulator [Raoultibacter sp.]
MNIENLECFVEVASCGNFTKAAERMFLVQSTASRRVQRLEEELGETLIVRDAPFFRLTREGELVFEKGREILDQMASLEARVHDKGEQARGSVCVGFYGLLEHLDISGYLHEYLKQWYPHIELTMFYNKVSCIEEDAKRRKPDVIVSLDCELPIDGYTRRMLLERRVVALVPRGHRFAQRSSIDLVDLRDEPLVFWTRSAVPGFFDALTDQCKQAGFTPRYTELYDLEDAIVMSVSAGNGISVFFDKTAVLTGDGVVEVPIDGLRVLVDVAYAYRTDAVSAGIAAVSKAFDEFASRSFPL